MSYIVGSRCTPNGATTVRRFPWNWRMQLRGGHINVPVHRSVSGETEESPATAADFESDHHKVRNGHDRRKTQLIGRASLATVAFLWGTYSPTMKFVLSSPGGPLPSTLSAIKNGLSSALLIATYIVLRMQSPPEQATEPKKYSHDGSLGAVGRLLRWKSGSLFWSVMEIGLLETCGSFSQTVGISLTSAINASFLIQSVTVFTPIVSSFAGDRLHPLGWAGCVTTLMGSLFVTLDLSLSGVSFSGGNLGDALIIMAAVCYAITTVRLGTLVEDFPPEQMATGHAIVSFVLAMAWVLTDITWMSGGSQGVLDLWPGYNQLVPWLAILWLAVGPESLASVFRNKGQQILPPSQAQIFFAATPFWSALIATCVLQTDAMRLEIWIGGSLILLGAVLSSHE